MSIDPLIALSVSSIDPSEIIAKASSVDGSITSKSFDFIGDIPDLIY